MDTNKKPLIDRVKEAIKEIDATLKSGNISQYPSLLNKLKHDFREDFPEMIEELLECEFFARDYLYNLEIIRDRLVDYKTEYYIINREKQ